MGWDDLNAGTMLLKKKTVMKENKKTTGSDEVWFSLKVGVKNPIFRSKKKKRTNKKAKDLTHQTFILDLKKHSYNVSVWPNYHKYHKNVVLKTHANNLNNIRFFDQKTLYSKLILSSFWYLDNKLYTKIWPKWVLVFIVMLSALFFGYHWCDRYVATQKPTRIRNRKK